MTITASKMEIVSEHRNLEQIRARNALKAADSIGKGKEGGRAVAKKVPAQIVQNGFLGALAFAIESSDNGRDDTNGYGNTFKALQKHLKDVGKDLGVCGGDLKGFLDGLCTKSADDLRLITDEALCYLNYLRRFAKPGKDDKSAESGV